MELAWHSFHLSQNIELHIGDLSRAHDTFGEFDAVLLDVDSPFFDDSDELLAAVGKARALGVLVAILLENPERLRADTDLYVELCEGLIFLHTAGIDVICASVLRRLDPLRSLRFEYLTVDPAGDQLVAIFGNGQTRLLERPLTPSDDGSPVTDIELTEDATCALISLNNRRQIQLRAQDLNLSAKSAPAAGLAAHVAHGEPDEHLGVRFRQLRLERGLTQAEVSKRSGIHRPNIARVERGRHVPSLETLRRLADAIGVTPSELLSS